MEIDTGSTAWVIVAAALVLLMTPGLSLFYGGMTRAKGVLNMMMMSFVSIIVVTVLWVLYGYSLAFDESGNSFLNNIIGGLDNLGLAGLHETATADDGSGIPSLVFSAFQLTFAIITVALISGAIADRAKFGAWVVFAALWATLVYFPVAHWVWGGGWLGSLGIMDFAGGTVVHINAGAAALALALVVGKRYGWRKEPMRPHNLPLVLLGAALLWFGWFGFNAGSELGVDMTTALAFMNTQIATAIAAGGWIVVEKLRDGHSTSLGVASGAVAGLVAITPSCAFVDSLGAAIIGLLAGVICAYAVGLKYKLGYDDSLDVVGVHLVGGLIGSVALGFVAAYPLEGQSAGLFYGGGVSQLGLQVLGPVVVMVYSFVVAWILGKIIDKVMGFRISEEAEITGIDITTHAETGYDLGTIHASGVATSNGPVTLPAAQPSEKKVDA
ncbi:ammonium transporter [Thermopolyspora flexuosa]|mgnify:CR=1 FL=1|uniref:Ammonium transporter n=1 Tax=Thermopolyspora flexuosa TaxID=103836 RepID=A0A543J141_9ACTN|nr:ammonium transporter [Thermopolyspora flexuosa]TQM76556.1 ammonium transporter [Thermopolyspora flexuosa]GGM85120.1 ammonium transporter [Thermopolyspora flexuosa]